MNKNILPRIIAAFTLIFAMVIPGSSIASASTVSKTAVVAQTNGSNDYANITIDASRENALRTAILRTAASQNGVRYLFATAEPGVSFDCSGFVAWVYYTNGIEMYRSVATMRPDVRRISESEVKPGDLIFSGHATDGSPSHVGIVADPKAKTYWSAVAPGDSVRLTSYASSWYTGSTFGTVITTTSPVQSNPTKVSASSAKKTTKTPTKAPTSTKRFVKSGIVLNVRASATTSSKIVARLKAGTAVTGTISNGWLKITDGTYAGKYVSASYLRS